MAVYRPAAQLGEEYGAMETDRGKTRGKFTELVFDVKHDAWVIPQFSHGILLIVDSEENVGTPSIKVEVVDNTPVAPVVTGVTVNPTTLALKANESATPQVQINGTGPFDRGYTAKASAPLVADVDGNGVIRAYTAGTSTVTYKAIGDATKTATCTVTVS